MDRDDVVSTLNDLIETCKNGEAGFLTCAERAGSADVKALMSDGATRCADGASELQQLVMSYGGEPETDGSIAGSLHRGWVNVKTAMTDNPDLAVLEECEKGEDVAKLAYANCLKTDLPPDVRMVVQRQYDGVLRNHDRVRAMRDTFRAAAQ